MGLSFGRAGMSALCVAGCLVLLAPLFPAGAEEAPVTLLSRDGTARLSGVLTGFDGERYALETSLGPIRIDALQVRCQGRGCPADPRLGGRLAILGGQALGPERLAALIQGYADSLGAETMAEPVSGPARAYRLFDASGAELVRIRVIASAPALRAGESLIAISAQSLPQAVGLIAVTRPCAAMRPVALTRQAHQPGRRLYLAPVAGRVTGHARLFLDFAGSARATEAMTLATARGCLPLAGITPARG